MGPALQRSARRFLCDSGYAGWPVRPLPPLTVLRSEEGRGETQIGGRPNVANLWSSGKSRVHRAPSEGDKSAGMPKLLGTGAEGGLGGVAGRDQERQSGRPRLTSAFPLPLGESRPFGARWQTKVTNRSLQVRIERVSDEGEPAAPGRPGDGSAEPNHAALQRPQGAAWSSNPGQPSMMPPPLGLSQIQNPPTRSIPSELPDYLQHQSVMMSDPPGLRIPPLTGFPPRPTIDASSSSPAVLPDRHPALAMPVPGGSQHPIYGQYETPRRPPYPLEPESHQSSQQASKESFYRQRPRPGPHLGEEQEQTPSRCVVLPQERVRQPRPSANLQSPRNRPFGPRSPGVWTTTDNTRTVLDGMAERLAQLGHTNSQGSRESMAGQHADLRRSAQRFRAYHPGVETTRSHMVLIQEPELVNLVARRILQITPESHPSPYLLRGNRGHVELVPGLLKESGVELRQNTARKPVMIENSSESTRRIRSCRIRIETILGNGRRPSSDSGYCTASSTTMLSSASLPPLSDWSEEWQVPGSPHELVGLPLGGRNSDLFSEHEPDKWLAWSRAANGNLRRRSSEPRLGGHFRLFLEVEEDADDESSRPQSQGSGSETTGRRDTLTGSTLTARRNSG